MLTIFGNIRINSPVRLEHLKSTIASFKNESDNWLINVRGALREEAISLLRAELGEKMVLFNLLDDSRGWITNALEMLPHAKYDYVLIMLEDHIYLAPPGTLSKVAKEMEANKVDYLPYSWWMFGKVRAVFDREAAQIGMKHLENISFLTLTKAKWSVVRARGHRYFLISMLGIFRKDFLQAMWAKDQHRWPLFFKKGIFKIFGALTRVGFPQQGHKEMFSKVNRYIFFNKLRKYPHFMPFETEKDPERVDMLPFVLAFPNQELFASIDDNLDEVGYSLTARGLYIPSDPNAPAEHYNDQKD